MAGHDIDSTEDQWSSVQGSGDARDSFDSPSRSWNPSDLDDAPARVGRYVLLREIGRGAIGVVYAAYHEGLDRRVAIKLLNRQRAGRADLEARLHREARALAKLSHPNVVQVYDVGRFAGRVFVAMEFVEGETLADWVRRSRTQSEIVAMFIAAGRGLAAAHAAGVVHRDFKPENVLVGIDGRPRVLDFGLARPAELGRSQAGHASEGSSANLTATNLSRQLERPVRPALADDPEQTRDAADPSEDPATYDEPPAELALTDPSEVGPATFENDGLLTRTGTLVGTPAYMSPEQFAGRNVDERSDQFGFCVALHEALYGVRPFVGRSALELAFEVQNGRIAKPPPGRELPGWLRAAILRGLETRPERRWPSMSALLDTLEQRSQRSRRWPWALAAAGLTGALALGVAAFAGDRVEACPSAADERASLWTPETAAAIQSAFLASQLPYAATTSERVASSLDRWAERWAEQRRASCSASQRRELSPELLDHRQACLERGKRAFESLTEQLADTDPTVIERAVEAVAELPDPERCADLDAMLAAAEQAPEALSEPIDALRSELAELDTMLATGRWTAGRVLAEQALARAQVLGFGPAEAEAQLRLALFDARLGATDLALARLQDALDLADRHGHERLIPTIATALVHLSIYDRPDPIRGRLWARRSLAALDRIDEQGIERARGLWMLGNLDRIAGELGSAEQHLRAALAIYERAEHPERGAVLNDIGNVLDARGDRVGAREVYYRARALIREAFGEGHPRLGHVEFNLARLALSEGRLDEARVQLDTAAAIYVEALGRDRRELGDVELARALVELQAGDLEPARAHAERAREVFDRTLGEDNVDRAEPHLTLGHVALAEGRAGQAVDHYRRGLAIQRAGLPDGHIALAATSTNLGLALLAAGEPGNAVTELERANALFEAGVEVDATELRSARALLGEALLARARPDDPARAAGVLALALESCDEATPASERLDLVVLAAKALDAAGEHDSARRRAREGLALAREGAAPTDPGALATLERLGGP
ncbi:protein kinase domain-containing protein [Nannocystaceae bacterium ST9]